jgi:hypothetical protein
MATGRPQPFASRLAKKAAINGSGVAASRKSSPPLYLASNDCSHLDKRAMGRPGGLPSGRTRMPDRACERICRFRRCQMPAAG